MDENEIYLDHAATTPPSPEVIAAMECSLRMIWGNPSSVHKSGLAAAHLREEARSRVLNALGLRFASPSRLIFTASGTEADNMAILGVAAAKRYSFTPKLITTDSEHPAVLQPALQLEKQGWEVVRLSTIGGVIDREQFASVLDERTVLVSIMAANNETGAIYDLKDLFALVHSRCPRALTHTDAVQAFGKLTLHPEKLGADLVSLSAHKIGGPKGAGALYLSDMVKKRRQLVPLIHGGGQEDGMRSGTESIPCIVGFGEAALAVSRLDLDARRARALALRERLIASLPESVTVNTPKGPYLPTTVSITLPGIRSEIMLRYLSERGIYLSAGSACSSHKDTVSPTLLAFGLSREHADCTLRISFSPDQSEEEMDRTCLALSAGIASLAKQREKRN